MLTEHVVGSRLPGRGVLKRGQTLVKIAVVMVVSRIWPERCADGAGPVFDQCLDSI